MSSLTHASRHLTSTPLAALIATLTVVVLVQSLSAQDAPPSTDIFVVSWQSTDGEVPMVGSVTRVTDRDGYDNQPAFLPPVGDQAPELAFTSANASGSTEILVHSLEDGATDTLISTPQKEYSPTQVPGSTAISVIRDYGNQRQELWRFDISGELPARDGAGAKHLLPDINPIGYHVWTTDGRLLLFVLGDPPTLRLAKPGPGSGTVLAENPGRALKRIPGSDRLAFVHKVAANEWWITSVDLESRKLERLFTTVEGSEDFAIAPDGAFWMAKDSHLYRRSPGDDAWQTVADLAASGIGGITRLAWDQKGERLAVVAAR